MLKAREAGFEIGSGNILGLPRQTDDDLADDILFLGRFNIVKMVSCAPFTPSDELPEYIRQTPPGDFDKTRRFISLLRLCFPDARIPGQLAMLTVRSYEAGGRMEKAAKHC